MSYLRQFWRCSLDYSKLFLFEGLSYESIEDRLGDLTERGVVLRESQTLKDLYEERVPLYEKYADVKISCDNLTPEECVEKIIAKLQSL